MPRNSLIVPTILPSLGKLQTSALNEQALNQQASSLVPDSNTFVKTIMDRDIHTAEANQYAGAINNLASEYLGEYSKNPYYAFSQQGKQQARKMQEIVNDPRFKQFENIKKLNESAFTKAQTAGLSDNLVMGDNGTIAVANRQTGKREMIHPDDVDHSIHQPLTVAQDYQFLDQFEGSSRLASYDTATLEDTQTAIRDVFKSLKTNTNSKEFDRIKSSFAGRKTNEFGVTQTVETETNKEQMANELANLQNYGLSQTAMKSLMSQYYRTNPGELGQEGSHDRATEWMFNQIGRIANGQRVDNRAVSSKKGIGFDDGEGGSNATAPLQKMQAWVMGGYSTDTDFKYANKHSTINTVSNFPAQEAFDSKFTNTDEHGRKVLITTPENSKIEQILDSNVFIGVNTDNEAEGLKEGDIRRIDPSILKNAAYEFGPLRMSDMYVDNAGEILSAKQVENLERAYQGGFMSSEQQSRYISTYNDPVTGEEKTGVPLRKVVQQKLMVGKKVGPFGVNLNNDPVLEDVEKSGYTFSERNVDEFRLRSGINLDSPGSIFAIDDEVATIETFRVVGSDFAVSVGSLALDDPRSLVPKSTSGVGEQRIRPAVGKNLTTNENAIRRGNAAQTSGRPTFNQ